MLDFAKNLIGDENSNNEIDFSCLEAFITNGHLQAAEHLIFHYYIPQEIGM